MSNGKSKSFRRRHILHIAHCSLLIGHLGSATAGSWRASTPELTRIGTMNAGFSPQIQSYRRFGFPPICGSPESAGKTSMVHGERRLTPVHLGFLFPATLRLARRKAGDSFGSETRRLFLRQS